MTTRTCKSCPATFTVPVKHGRRSPRLEVVYCDACAWKRRMEHTHGTLPSYDRGCRCVSCKAVNVERQRAAYDRRKLRDWLSTRRAA